MQQVSCENIHNALHTHPPVSDTEVRFSHMNSICKLQITSQLDKPPSWPELTGILPVHGEQILIICMTLS